jgi:hypothetical protein
MTILSSRVKKAAQKGPVFITEDDKPTHVLLTIEAYRKLIGGQPRIADLLAMPHGSAVEFDQIAIGIRPADLT